MKHIYLLIAIVLWVCENGVYAQNVTFTATANTALTYDISTITGIESAQTISGALTLRIKNRAGGAKSVYARISAYTAPAGFTPSSSNLQVDYTSDNSSSESNLITTPLTLTTTDQRLFTHAQHSNNSTYNFNYNLILQPTNWQWPPGAYSFTILFTFVAP